jgi:hypothetical protein
MPASFQNRGTFTERSRDTAKRTLRKPGLPMRVLKARPPARGFRPTDDAIWLFVKRGDQLKIDFSADPAGILGAPRKRNLGHKGRGI